MARGWIDGPEGVGGAALIARQARNGGRKIFVGRRVIIWRSEVQQMMSIHRVEQINVAIGSELRIQSKAKQPKVLPITDLLTNIYQRGERGVVWVFKPNPSRSFPYEHATCFV